MVLEIGVRAITFAYPAAPVPVPFLIPLPVRLIKHYRVQLVYDQVCSVCVSLRSKCFRGVSAQISMFWPRES